VVDALLSRPTPGGWGKRLTRSVFFFAFRGPPAMPRSVRGLVAQVVMGIGPRPRHNPPRRVDTADAVGKIDG
jgi:hypothetical protein